MAVCSCLTVITERAVGFFILSPSTGKRNTGDCFRTHLLLLLTHLQLVMLLVRIPTSWRCRVCACCNTHSGSGGDQPAVCRIRNARVNPSYDGFKERTNTQGHLCTGVLAGSLGQVLLLNWLFGIT